MKILPHSISNFAPESSSRSSSACSSLLFEDLTANSMAFADDKSPSDPPPIPPAMLRSRCAFRISFRILPISPTSVDILDFRYTEWHAGMHHDHTPHQYESSFEMDTKRVSNSAGQYYVVHRLIRSSSDGKMVELSGHCPHGGSSHGCSCINDPYFIIAIANSRSEVVENYLKEHVKVHNELVCEGEQKAFKAVRLSETEREISEAEQKAFAAMRRISEYERELSAAKQKSLAADREISEAKQKAFAADREIAEAERSLSDTLRRLDDTLRRLDVAMTALSEAEKRANMLCFEK